MAAIPSRSICRCPRDRLQDFPILIRTRAAPTQIMNAIGPMILSIDPNLVAYSFTLEEMLRQTESFLASSISAAIAWSVGMFGLLLASMGIYGTVSYIVVLRTREVGIRMALGAKRSDVLILMLRESTRPVLAGLIGRNVSCRGASLFAARHALWTPHRRRHLIRRRFARVSGHRAARRLPAVQTSHAC